MIHACQEQSLDEDEANIDYLNGYERGWLPSVHGGDARFMEIGKNEITKETGKYDIRSKRKNGW